MKRYKIAIISDWFLPRIGGLELHIRDLGLELCRRGHEAHIVTATPSLLQKEVEGLRVHRLGVPLLPGLGTVRGPQALRALEELFRRERFDIVHCHTALSPLSHCGALLARRLGIPSVLTEHSVLRGTGTVILSALNQLCSWGGWPDVLTAVSSYVAGDVRRVTGRDDVVVLPNGINPEEWAVPCPGPAEPVRPGPLRVVSVMRFTRRKRPRDVIRAIPHILSRLPAGPRPRFTLIGDGPERERVVREVARQGVGDCVELPGFLPRPRIREVLGQADLFILPTSKEALSIATLEARCVGLPVVAMNHGGVGDLIRHGREGFLANTTEEFIGHIAELLRDAGLRRRMAASTREGLDRFSWTTVIDQHLQVYGLAAQRCREAAYRPEPAYVEDPSPI